MNDLKDLVFKLLSGLAPLAIVAVIALWRDHALLKQQVNAHDDQPHDGVVRDRDLELELRLRDQADTQMLIQIEQERIRNDRQDDLIQRVLTGN